MDPGFYSELYFSPFHLTFIEDLFNCSFLLFFLFYLFIFILVHSISLCDPSGSQS